MAEPSPTPPGALDPSWAELARPPKGLVVGLGGAGSEAVSEVYDQAFPGVDTLAINTDGQHLLRSRAHQRILLGQRELKGRGSGGNLPSVLRATEEAREELRNRLRSYDLVFLVAGLGGGTGSALAPFCLALAQAEGAVPITSVFLPFHAELTGSRVLRENTVRALSELKRAGGLLLPFSNEKLRRYDRLPVRQVFQFRNAYLKALVSGLMDMLQHPSEVNVDLSHLHRHLSRGGLTTLLTGEGHPSDPGGLARQALHDGLLDFRLSEAGPALLFVEGGSELTLGAYHRVVEAFRTELKDPPDLIPGIRVHEERWDSVRVTLLLGGLPEESLAQALGSLGP